LTAEDKRDFQQGTLEAGQYQDKLYAWPWNANGTCLLVNKSIFQAARSTDVMPDADGFWEFGQCLLAFAVATATSKDRYGFATSFKDKTDPYQPYSFLWGYGAAIFSTIGIERYTFDWPQAEAGLEWLVDLDSKLKLMMPGLAGATSDDIISSFVKGKVAIIPATTAWNSAYFQSLYSKGEADPAKLDVVPAMFPNLIETDPLRTYADTHSWIVFKQTDAYKRQLLMDFCSYCCNADNQKWSVPAEYLPVRKSAADVWGSDSIMQFMSKWSLTYAHPDGIHPLFKDVHKILVPAFQQALTLSKTPKRALQDAATDVNKLIAS
jgi:ABC-type glycerol-3-phosphate transport system substrate-binding protein